MKIIKKLKLTFHKLDFAEAIDFFYTLMHMWQKYYAIFVAAVGLFYLSEYIPGNILNKIWGEIPLDFIGVQFQNGTFSELVMSFLLLFAFFDTADNFLTNYPRRVKMLSIVEIWISYMLVKIGASRTPVVSPDAIMIFVCWFFVIRLALKAITAKFKISTRHFGYFMEIECPPIELAVKKSISDKDTGTKEE